MESRAVVVTYPLDDANTVQARDPRLMISVTMEKLEDLEAARAAISADRMLGWTGTGDPHLRPSPDTRYRFLGHAPADFYAGGRPRPLVVGFEGQ